jgi:hypothetical protein
MSFGGPLKLSFGPGGGGRPRLGGSATSAPLLLSRVPYSAIQERGLFAIQQLATTEVEVDRRYLWVAPSPQFLSSSPLAPLISLFPANTGQRAVYVDE